MVEFVSANPTGAAAHRARASGGLGDTLCNPLETQGCTVHREFYYNDAGNQIDNLARSVQLRDGRGAGQRAVAGGWLSR